MNVESQEFNSSCIIHMVYFSDHNQKPKFCNAVQENKGVLR